MLPRDYLGKQQAVAATLYRYESCVLVANELLHSNFPTVRVRFYFAEVDVFLSRDAKVEFAEVKCVTYGQASAFSEYVEVAYATVHHEEKT